MPKTGRDAKAAIRARYLREHPDAAAGGIGRSSLGLDEATQGQFHLRALLALGILNCGRIEGPPGYWGLLSRLPDYTVTFSPRWNRLIVIFPGEDDPFKMVDYLVPGSHGPFGIPGLRIHEQSLSRRTTVCRHLPTGAILEITSLKVPQAIADSAKAPTPQAPGLTRREVRALSELPPMTRDAQRLLAAIAVRLRSCDAQGRWAVGDKYYEPGGPFPISSLIEDLRAPWGGQRRLWGSGDFWKLTWDPFQHRPSPAEIAAAFTDPVIGLRGATVTQHSDRLEIGLGTATLALEPRRLP